MKEKENKNWFEPDEEKRVKGFTREDFENLCKMIWDAPPEPRIVGECVMLHPKPHRVFIVEEPRLAGTPCPTTIELPEGCITMEAYFNSMLPRCYPKRKQLAKQ